MSVSERGGTLDDALRLRMVEDHRFGRVHAESDVRWHSWRLDGRTKLSRFHVFYKNKLDFANRFDLIFFLILA
jgi:hypothetical protein